MNSYLWSNYIFIYGVNNEKQIPDHKIEKKKWKTDLFYKLYSFRNYMYIILIIWQIKVLRRFNHIAVVVIAEWSVIIY